MHQHALHIMLVPALLAMNHDHQGLSATPAGIGAMPCPWGGGTTLDVHRRV
jgi:hypothetical protein